MGTLNYQQAPSFGWDIKPRSLKISVVIKNSVALVIKSRVVTPVFWCSKFLPLALVNHGLLITLIHLFGSISLSSPPVAGVWWVFWRRYPVAAIASSKWMLHTGGGWGETPPPPPHMIVKRTGCTEIHNKSQYKCIIHSFMTPHRLQ